MIMMPTMTRQIQPTDLPELSDDDFTKLAMILQNNCGIALGPEKRTLTVARLSRRLRILELNSFSEYLSILNGENGQQEITCLILALTTNVTSFFREKHHFEILRDRLRNLLFRKLRGGEKVRIWSAGCSSGQEAYSIAMTILEVAPDIASMDIKILATDIDTDVIKTASEGIYRIRDCELGENQWAQKYFSKYNNDSNHMEIESSARDLVHFAPLNLMSEWPMKGRFDHIFCRNVAIYFDEVTRETLWSRFAGKLKMDGLLSIGHSERVTGSAQNLLTPLAHTTYSKTVVDENQKVEI